MGKFITNSWANSNTWANFNYYKFMDKFKYMGKFMRHRPRSRLKKKKNAEDALVFNNVFAVK